MHCGPPGSSLHAILQKTLEWVAIAFSGAVPNTGIAPKSLALQDFYISQHNILVLTVPHHLDQFSSVAQSCPTLYNPMNSSKPGLPVHHQLPEFTQTHVHQVGDATQGSHPLSSPSPPDLSFSQHQGFFPMSQLFASGGQSIGVSGSTSVLPMNIQD